MELSEIDKNFELKLKGFTQKQDLYKLPNSNFDIYGVYYSEKDKRFLRMDLDVAKNVNNSIFELAKYTTGGRVRFSTNSSILSLRIKQSAIQKIPHMSDLGSSGLILLEDTENEPKFVCAFIPFHYLNKNEVILEDGYYMERTISNDKKVKNYTLFFPNYIDIEEIQIGLNEGSYIGKGKKVKDNKPILYYGSSITQGACASRPDNAYPNFIFKWTNVDFINLGFSGACLAEDEMIKYLINIDCSIFVCDYDHNAQSLEYLNDTHFKLYSEFRKIKPNVPYVIISMPFDACGNWNERREIIYNTYKKAVESGDKHVYFIDGSKLFKTDSDSCVVDGTHPNDLGLFYMAKTIFEKFKEEKLI